MWARRPILCGILLVGAGLASGGCEQLAPYRQGVLTTYNKELRQLGEDVNKRALAKDTDEQPATSVQPANEQVIQASQWHAPPLLDAVRLRPPVPFDAQ